MSTPEYAPDFNTLRDELAQRIAHLGGFRGTGLTAGPGGKSVLVVYVDYPDCPAAKATPKALGEIPVRVQVTGKIQPR